MSTRFGGLPGRFWRWSFLRHFRRRIHAMLPRDSRTLTRRVRQEAASIYDSATKPDPRRKGHMIVNMCSLVLAAYRAVEEKTGDARLAFDIAQQAFGETFRTPVRLMFRLFLKLYRDPVGKLSRMNLPERAHKAYGKSMEFDQEVTSDGVDLLVRRCSFHQFFADHGAPGLTLAICHWDRNWMDLLDAGARPIRTERPSTISTGGDCCRFRYIRDTDKHEQGANDVVLVNLSRSAPVEQASVVTPRTPPPSECTANP